MTVGELISELRRFDEDENIYVGEYQDYGCDFVYGISDVERNGISKFYGNDIKSAPMLIMGSQCGVIGTGDEVDDE